MLHALRIILIALMVLLLAVLVPSGAATAQVKALPTDASGGLPPLAEGYLSDTEYQDESMHVTFSQGRMHDTNWMAVSVTIASASQLRTSVAGTYRSPGAAFATTMARRVNAVLAINGDYYGFNTSGYCVRQGTVIRCKAQGDFDALLIDSQGDFHILRGATQQMCDDWPGTVVNAFHFGPGLIIGGERITEFTREALYGKGADKAAQRICIAQTGPLSYMVIYCEGPENAGSTGMTIAQFVDLIASFGNIQNAYNLDGGSSSTIVFNSKKVNGLSSKKMRQVSDIIYFASAFAPDGD